MIKIYNCNFVSDSTSFTLAGIKLKKNEKPEGTSYQGSIKSQVSSSYILMSAISQDQVFTIQPEQRNKYDTFDIYQ